MRVVLRKSTADEVCRYWGLPLVKAMCKRAATSMPAEASPRLTSENAATHSQSIPHPTKNASRKSLRPRLVVQKSVARRALCTPLPRLAFTKSGCVVVRW